MPGKVFISCGQNSAQERQTTQDVSVWLSGQGFTPYVAIRAATILDLNSGIIDELRSSDYYLFINFKREEISRGGGGGSIFRGSVYTNQELAIAYALGFEHMILLNQQGTTPEGVHAFIVSNIPEFANHTDVLTLVQNAIADARWSSSFSRHLTFDNLNWVGPLFFTDHTGKRQVRGLQARIKNNRPDKGAINCVARLAFITDPSGSKSPCFDRSPLKITGQIGYSQTIWPSNYGEFDLLAVDISAPSHVYLLSSLDVVPRQEIIKQMGHYILEYEVYSIGFPVLQFKIDFDVTGNYGTTNAQVIPW